MSILVFGLVAVNAVHYGYMELFGVRVDNVTLEEVVKMVEGVIKEPRRLPLFIVTPNPEQIVQAQDDSEFNKILNQADINIPDGFGLVWASVILAQRSRLNAKCTKEKALGVKHYALSPLTKRVSGVEVMEAIAKLGKKNMFVGGKAGAAQKTAEKLGGIGLQEPDVAAINKFQPECLFVGLGAPKQEKWVAKQLQATSYKLQAKVVMVVGGAIDQIADPTLKPPKWLDRVGLGWLYRLVRQPWRIKRQLRLVKFGGMVLKAKLS